MSDALSAHSEDTPEHRYPSPDTVPAGRGKHRGPAAQAEETRQGGRGRHRAAPAEDRARS
ncbi:hypothetical protein [Streptomyces sp. JJ36]|uniref:hypothetical protein n=1 Tax=Streptomyces sp. JJ36 TaxID=2736645 RepID=UPI001F185464|nr:hypothetical protein [Streptomyces sp. JJ36]MCF6526409.1 hypothetical protein [Streptomyces sp. JJ36]